VWCDWCQIPFDEADRVLEVTKTVDATGMNPTGSREYVTARVNIHHRCMNSNYGNPTPVENPAATS
jgi:hypothetical protein